MIEDNDSALHIETSEDVIARLRSLLASMEWSGAPRVTPDHRLQPTCPSCQHYDAHGIDCALTAEIK